MSNHYAICRFDDEDGEYCEVLDGKRIEALMQQPEFAEKVAELDRLRDSAGKVISAFEALGRTEGIAATIEARARCERVMVALKQTMTPN